MNRKLGIGVLAVFGLVIIWASLNTDNAGVTELPFGEEVVQCISNELTFYSLSTCPHCREQKEILGDYLDDFEEVECSIQSQRCTLEGIQKVPTWADKEGNKYNGVKTWQQLRTIAGC